MPCEVWKYSFSVSLGTQTKLRRGGRGTCGDTVELLPWPYKVNSRVGQHWCLTMGNHTGHYVLALVQQATERNRTQRTPISLSILALWWPSAPGIAAMWAWLQSTISVCSATWHWEARIRWLHYCKWLTPVTHTNTHTCVCSLEIHIHVCTVFAALPHMRAVNLHLVTEKL